jgi:hypothetical protein
MIDGILATAGLLVVRRGFSDADLKVLTSANADRTTPVISTTDH